MDHIDLHMLHIISWHLNDELVALFVDGDDAGGLRGRLDLYSNPY